MALLYRLKLHGTGGQGDPFRVNLPTANLIHGNVSERWAIVAVPDDTLGVSFEQIAQQDKQEATEGTLLPGPDVDFVNTANAHLKTAYPFQFPPFALEVA